MRVRILGSGAGGGVPQWNCACAICRGARHGTLPVTPRSQASAAVSAGGDAWFLLHASPDVRQQIESFAPLHPRATRDSPIAGVLLASGDLDACLGLFVLRESQPLAVHATRAVRHDLCDGNTIARTLERVPGQIAWRDLVPGVEQPVRDAHGNPAGLAVTAVPVPGKVPFHLVGRRAASAEDTVALRIRDQDSGAVLVWAPSVAGPAGVLERLLSEAHLVLFDGTFWSPDELAEAGAGSRRAAEMGHWPVGGPGGSLELLARLAGPRRLLIHINNTNPLLVEGSPEREAARAAGVEVAHDGLEMTI